MIKISKIAQFLTENPSDVFDIEGKVFIKNTYNGAEYEPGKDLSFDFEKNPPIRPSIIRLFEIGERPAFTKHEQSPGMLEMYANKLRLLHSLIDFEVNKNT